MTKCRGMLFILILVSFLFSFVTGDEDDDDFSMYDDETDTPDEFGQDVSDFLTSSMDDDHDEGDSDDHDFDFFDPEDTPSVSLESLKNMLSDGTRAHDPNEHVQTKEVVNNTPDGEHIPATGHIKPEDTKSTIVESAEKPMENKANPTDPSTSHPIVNEAIVPPALNTTNDDLKKENSTENGVPGKTTENRTVANETVTPDVAKNQTDVTNKTIAAETVANKTVTEQTDATKIVADKTASEKKHTENETMEKPAAVKTTNDIDTTTSGKADPKTVNPENGREHFRKTAAEETAAKEINIEKPVAEKATNDKTNTDKTTDKILSGRLDTTDIEKAKLFNEAEESKEKVVWNPHWENFKDKQLGANKPPVKIHSKNMQTLRRQDSPIKETNSFIRERKDQTHFHPQNTIQDLDTTFPKFIALFLTVIFVLVFVSALFIRLTNGSENDDKFDQELGYIEHFNTYRSTTDSDTEIA